MNLDSDFASRGSDEQTLVCDWLSALYEPAAVVRTTGEIIEVNRAFRRKFADASQGKRLHDFLGDAPDRLTNYLRACSSSGEPLLGSLRSSGDQQFTTRGSRFPLGQAVAVLLRLFEPDERFARLTATVKDLNDLLRQREHEKAQLQEALNDRDILHRELQHRVKNNMQMLAGLLHAAKTDNESDAAKSTLEEASRRFAAVAAAHQSLYQLDNLRSVAAEPLISQIATTAAHASPRDVQVECLVDEVQLPNDICTPLALVVNELVTNALKHAHNDSGPLKIEVRLSASGCEAQLDVHDNGIGFPAPSVLKRGSGIGLVKGLVRQLRGKLTISSEEGTTISIWFPLPRPK